MSVPIKQKWDSNEMRQTKDSYSHTSSLSHKHPKKKSRQVRSLVRVTGEWNINETKQIQQTYVILLKLLILYCLNTKNIQQKNCEGHFKNWEGIVEKRIPKSRWKNKIKYRYWEWASMCLHVVVEREETCNEIVKQWWVDPQQSEWQAVELQQQKQQDFDSWERKRAVEIWCGKGQRQKTWVTILTDC